MTSLVARNIVLRQITVPEKVLCTTKPEVLTAEPQQICLMIVVSTLIDVYVDCMLLFETDIHYKPNVLKSKLNIRIAFCRFIEFGVEKWA